MTNERTTSLITALCATIALDSARLPKPDDFDSMTEFYRRDLTLTNAESARRARLADAAFAALTDDELRALMLDLFDCRTLKSFNRQFANSDDYEYIFDKFADMHTNPIANAFCHAIESRLDLNN